MKYILVIWGVIISLSMQAQSDIITKRVTLYSMQDTLGVICLNDSLFLRNFKRQEWVYDTLGRVLQEVQYPSPYSLAGGTTKIIEFEYLDSIRIRKIYTGKRELISEMTCIREGLIQECTTVEHGKLSSSSYEELENKKMTVELYDKDKNGRRIIKMIKFGNSVDTLENFFISNSTGHSRRTEEVVKFDTILNSRLGLRGYVRISDGDTLEINSVQEIWIDARTRLVQRLVVDFRKDEISRSETLWQDDLLSYRNQYDLVDNNWEIRKKQSKYYNSNNDEIMSIEDSYEAGEFLYRFVMYRKYAYYD